MTPAQLKLILVKPSVLSCNFCTEAYPPSRSKVNDLKTMLSQSSSAEAETELGKRFKSLKNLKNQKKRLKILYFLGKLESLTGNMENLCSKDVFRLNATVTTFSLTNYFSHEKKKFYMNLSKKYFFLKKCLKV